MSSAETIPYDYDDGIPFERSASVGSTIPFKSDEDNTKTIAELFTHHYNPDRPSAPYSEDRTVNVPETSIDNELPVMRKRQTADVCVVYDVVRRSVCVCVRMCACTCVRTYMCVCTYMCECTCMCVCVCLCV